MNRNFLIAICLVVLNLPLAFSQSPIVFNLIGYASLNGGTTGGQEGATVRVTTLKELKHYAEEKNTSYFIIVSGHLTSGDDKGATILVNSNKTIIGEGEGAFLDGIGLAIARQRNIILRNLKISLNSITNTSDPKVYDADGDEGRPQIKTNGGDCIKITSSENLWIDHCEFFSQDPWVQKNQDLYDGLLDVNESSNYITISWNYFHHHHKGTLVGGSDKDSKERQITFHHNFFFKMSQRMPSYRFGKAHIFNNYYLQGKSSGINSRMGACLKIEKNYFESCLTPVTSLTEGKYELVDNRYDSCTGSQPDSSTCTLNIPYEYGEALEETSEAKNSVKKYSGLGKISDPHFQCDSLGLIMADSTSSKTGKPILLQAVAKAGKGKVVKVQFYHGTTLIGEDTTCPFELKWKHPMSGAYQVKAVMFDNIHQSVTSKEKILLVN